MIASKTVASIVAAGLLAISGYTTGFAEVVKVDPALKTYSKVRGVS